MEILWLPSLSWWFILFSWTTSLMNDTFRSSCRVSLVTYQGAFVTIRSILGWLLCILAICDLLAHPYNSIPLVQIGFMIVLYRSILLSSDAGDFLRMIQCKSFTFWSTVFVFLYAVPTLAWNPNIGQGTSQLVIVELLYCLCKLLDTALSSVWKRPAQIWLN
jgi:hypothetical protein